MAKIKIINGDCNNYSLKANMILTDPPYEMSGKYIAEVIKKYDADHIVLITSMSQLIEFMSHSNYEFSFDFILDAVVPKKSKNLHQPNYTHQNGVYLKSKGVKSAFNRKLRQRSDTFDNNGYWPTILRAPRDNMHEHGMSKNLNIITDILGSFDIKSVVDLFGGAGTTAIAASELNIDCTTIEIDKSLCEKTANSLKFLGSNIEKINF